jgi:hypothetical protein
MRIPAWRVALTGAAVTTLAVAGIGFVAATNAPSGATPAIAAPAAAGTSSGAAGDVAVNLTADLAASITADDQVAPAGARVLGRLLRAGRHLVHAEVTVTDKDGNLIDLQFDHGTVQSIGGGKLTIAEAGGGTETVSTSDATIVRVGRTKGDLGDVTVGAEVVVQSRVDGGTVLAKRILIIPASAG